MSTDDMRYDLKHNCRYSDSRSWRNKVDKMGDKQVVAVYYKFIEGAGYFANQK